MECTVKTKNFSGKVVSEKVILPALGLRERHARALAALIATYGPDAIDWVTMHGVTIQPTQNRGAP